MNYIESVIHIISTSLPLKLMAIIRNITILLLAVSNISGTTTPGKYSVSCVSLIN